MCIRDRLYHVSDPAAALEFLSRVCGGLLLVETVVGPGDATDREAINPTTEDPSLLVCGTSGRGCRPSRAWFHARLCELFEYVYTPLTQPNHYLYPVDWTQTSPFTRRAMFVASRTRLDNPQLSLELLDRQVRH